MLEWLGIEKASEFDPTYFDLKEVNFYDPKKALREHKKRFGM